MKKYLAIPAVLAAIVAGCGDAETTTTDSPATEAETAATTTTDAPETEELVAEQTESEKLADDYAKAAPKDLAVVCQNAETIGIAKTAQMASRILGPQIIRLGGDVDETIDALLERC